MHHPPAGGHAAAGDDDHGALAAVQRLDRREKTDPVRV